MYVFSCALSMTCRHENFTKQKKLIRSDRFVLQELMEIHGEMRIKFSGRPNVLHAFHIPAQLGESADQCLR